MVCFSKIKEFDLTEKEKKYLEEIFSPISYDPTGSEAYITDLFKKIYNTFPDRILFFIEENKLKKNQTPCIYVKNLPIDKNICGSPKFHETGALHKDGTLSENIIVAFSLLIGEPYTIKFEGTELVNNIVPHQSHHYKYTGLGSNVELDLHIENAALNFLFENDCSPSGVILLGLRKDPNEKVFTYSSDIFSALSVLDKKTINILREPQFNLKLPYRWRKVMNTNMTKKVPLITGYDDSPRVHAIFYPDMIYIENQDAKKAFQKLYHALQNTKIGLDIGPGELLYINNRISLHSRSAFNPTYQKDGIGYRWLQRTFITQDIWGMRHFKLKGRVYDPSLIFTKLNSLTLTELL
jgi:L-asparagine oxygenase